VEIWELKTYIRRFLSHTSEFGNKVRRVAGCEEAVAQLAVAVLAKAEDVAATGQRQHMAATRRH
jgi:hypothetical protein